jgi:hypothetical protein
MTDEQIIDAYCATHPVRERRRLRIKTYLECAKKLYDAKKENLRYFEENLLSYLSEYFEYAGVVNLGTCIGILEEIRRDVIDPPDLLTIEYAKVLQLLLRCYFDQYYQGEGTYLDDTQGNIIRVLEAFIEARKQSNNDLQWSQIASEINEMVTDMIFSEAKDETRDSSKLWWQQYMNLKDEMPKVSKWWLEHQNEWEK